MFESLVRELERKRYSFSLSFDKHYIWEMDDYWSYKTQPASMLRKEAIKTNQEKTRLSWVQIWSSVLNSSDILSCDPHDNFGNRYNHHNFYGCGNWGKEKVNDISTWPMIKPTFDPLVFWHIKPYSFLDPWCLRFADCVYTNKSMTHL